jgi:hypothetical protein
MDWTRLVFYLVLDCEYCLLILRNVLKINQFLFVQTHLVAETATTNLQLPNPAIHLLAQHK